METMRVRSGAAELAVDTYGSGPRTIVALHPGVGDRRFWQACGETWAGAGHRVVAYDRRGYGATTYQPEAHDQHDDLRAVLAETADGGPVVLVGNSMGGALALEFALADHGRVAGLVLVGSVGTGLTAEDWPVSEAEQALERQIMAADQAGDLEEVNRLEAHFWLDGPGQPEGRIGGSVRQLFLDANGIALRAEDPGEAVGHPATWPRLGELGCPTLVVAGEYDEEGLVVNARRMPEQIPQARAVVLPGTAHCPSLDVPYALSTQVLTLLADLD